jgi:hypothetical protein
VHIDESFKFNPKGDRIRTRLTCIINENVSRSKRKVKTVDYIGEGERLKYGMLLAEQFCTDGHAG